MRPALDFCGTASGSAIPASLSAAPRCSISDRRRACGRTRVSSRPTSADGGRVHSQACRRIPPSPSCPGCTPSSTSTWSGGSSRIWLSIRASGNGTRDRNGSRGAGLRGACQQRPRGCCWRAPRSGSCRSARRTGRRRSSRGSGQVHLAARQPELRDVGEPQLVGRRGPEGVVDQVLGRIGYLALVRAVPRPPLGVHDRQPFLAHDAAHHLPGHRDRVVPRPQRVRDVAVT